MVVDLPTWEIPKIIPIGNLACRPNIKKNGVSCIVELKDASEMEETLTQGRKYGDPAHPVEASPLPEHQQVTTSPPNPEQEEGEVTPSDADVPDSIASPGRDTWFDYFCPRSVPSVVINPSSGPLKSSNPRS